jgi:hypothetical protein
MVCSEDQPALTDELLTALIIIGKMSTINLGVGEIYALVCLDLVFISQYLSF